MSQDRISLLRQMLASARNSVLWNSPRIKEASLHAMTREEAGFAVAESVVAEWIAMAERTECAAQACATFALPAEEYAAS